MKRTLLSLVFLFFSSIVFSQNQDSIAADTIKYWKAGGQIGLAFSQVSLTHWASGGQNSFSGNGILRLTATYTKNKSSWDSYILTGYGIMQQGDGKWIKNDDKLELFSKYGYKAGKSWYYSGMLNFRSQFTPGYNNPQEATEKNSDFFSPAYLMSSIGMDFKPNDQFALLLSPITSKLTIVLDDSLSQIGAYGVPKGEKLRSEFGGFIKMIYKKDNLIKNVNLATTLDLFSNYLEHPERVDVNWEVFIAMKVTKLLTVTLNTQLIYDYDIKFIEIENTLPVEKTEVQFKEVLGLGLSYNF
jgi:hypothetical protein